MLFSSLLITKPHHRYGLLLSARCFQCAHLVLPPRRFGPYDYSHFTDKEAEASSGHSALKMQSDLNSSARFREGWPSYFSVAIKLAAGREELRGRASAFRERVRTPKYPEALGTPSNKTFCSDENVLSPCHPVW